MGEAYHYKGFTIVEQLNGGCIAYYPDGTILGRFPSLMHARRAVQAEIG